MSPPFQVPGVTDRGLKPRAMKHIAVLGGGLMGSGIATACLLSGCTVLLKEVNDQFLQAGLGRIKANFESAVKKGRMKKQMAEGLMKRVQGTLDWSSFGKCDMVIEAVIEDLALKQQIFVELEKCCSAECILSTNTSTINIEKIAAKMARPERIVGAHFFSPAHVMQLFEIVRTPHTPPQVRQRALADHAWPTMLALTTIAQQRAACHQAHTPLNTRRRRWCLTLSPSARSSRRPPSSLATAPASPSTVSSSPTP